MKTKWKTINNYPDYDVNNQGRVRSRKWSKPKIMKMSLRNEYPVVTLTNYNSSRKMYVHTLVLQAFRGIRPDGHECCHSNGDRSDNRLSNSRWGTPKNNGEDQVRNGMSTRGARNRHCKLTTKEVKAIRNDVRLNKVISKDYNISEANVSAIKNRRSWAWLK